MVSLKKWVFIFFAVFILCVSVYGKQNISQISGVYLMQDVALDKLSTGSPIFLFSKLTLPNIHQGNIIIIGTTTKIKGTVIGDIYCIGSDLTFEEGAYVSGDINFFSSKIETSDRDMIRSMIPATSLFLEKHEESNKFVFDNVFPFYFYSICISFINSIIGVILLSVFKSFFQQGSIVVLKETGKVINYGSLFYSLTIVLIIVFIISIVGFPIALIFTVFLVTLICCGSVSLSICVGFLVNKKLLRNADTYSLYFLGSILIEAVKCTPYVGIIFYFIFIPIFTIGIILKTFMNRVLFKINYSIPYSALLNTATFDKNMIKQIIFKLR